VLLGSECTDGQGTCVHQPPLDGDRTEPDAAPEAGPPEAGPSEAGAPDFEPLPILNPDFERNGGLGGDLVVSNFLGGLIPIPPVTLVFAELPNWYACWFLAVNSVSWEVDDAGVPQRVGDYLSFALENIPVRQKLEAPMQAGTTYAFEMDVVGQADNGAELYVAVKGANDVCAAGTLLGRSANIPARNGWGTTCVEFTADQDYSHLLIVPGYEGPKPPASTRLWLDTLRQVPSCSR
jgi:hypothetical protein